MDARTGGVLSLYREHLKDRVREIDEGFQLLIALRSSVSIHADVIGISHHKIHGSASWNRGQASGAGTKGYIGHCIAVLRNQVFDKKLITGRCSDCGGIIRSDGNVVCLCGSPCGRNPLHFHFKIKIITIIGRHVGKAGNSDLIISTAAEFDIVIGCARQIQFGCNIRRHIRAIITHPRAHRKMIRADIDIITIQTDHIPCNRRNLQLRRGMHRLNRNK